jgi:hypothetical protein
VQEQFDRLLKQYGRVAIAGVSNSGKSTLARSCHDRTVIHTDDWKQGSKTSPAGKFWVPGLTWDSTPHVIAKACPDGPLLIEGIRTLGVIRAGLKVDALVWLNDSLLPMDSKQTSSARGRRTNFERFLADGWGAGIDVFRP